MHIESVIFLTTLEMFGATVPAPYESDAQSDAHPQTADCGHRGNSVMRPVIGKLVFPLLACTRTPTRMAIIVSDDHLKTFITESIATQFCI